MKVLRKYYKAMSPRRHVYCYCILGLMEKGYSYKRAKQLVLKSELLDYTTKYPELVFHATKEEWIDWILKNTY